MKYIIYFKVEMFYWDIISLQLDISKYFWCFMTADYRINERINLNSVSITVSMQGSYNPLKDWILIAQIHNQERYDLAYRI